MRREVEQKIQLKQQEFDKMTRALPYSTEFQHPEQPFLKEYRVGLTREIHDKQYTGSRKSSRNDQFNSYSSSRNDHNQSSRNRLDEDHQD